MPKFITISIKSLHRTSINTLTIHALLQRPKLWGGYWWKLFEIIFLISGPTINWKASICNPVLCKRESNINWRKVVSCEWNLLLVFQKWLSVLCDRFNLCAIKSCKRVKTKRVQLQSNAISKAKEREREEERKQVSPSGSLLISRSSFRLGGGLLQSQMSSLGQSNATEGAITIATAQSPAVTLEWRWVLWARRPLNLGRTST